MAAVLGLLSALLAVVVPLLPVSHDVTTLKWPTAEGTRSVSAPLLTHEPLWLNAIVPCAAARGLDDRINGAGELLATNAPSGTYGGLTGMHLQIDNGQVSFFSRGHQIGAAALPAGECAITVNSDAGETRADVAGVPLGSAVGDQRPQLTGIYSQLDDQRDDVRGLDFQAGVDTRFATTPTALKTAAAAHPADSLRRTCWPSRGSTPRLSSSQLTTPRNSAGNRTHGVAAEMCTHSA